MKRKNVMKVILLVLCMAGGCLFQFGNKQAVLNDLAMDNIEALAGGEGTGGYTCLGSGSVDCHGDYVEIKVDGYSLGIE